MSDTEGKIQSLLQRLETERDELRVKLNLAKMEAREEWEELEEKIQGLKARMKVVGDEAREAGGDVGAAFDVVAEEVKEGFARIRKLL